MDQRLLTKVSARTAAEICGNFDPSEEARKLLEKGVTPREFIELLYQSRLYPDAFDFLAHALPRREAIWWACMGVRHALGTALPPKQFAALKAAVEWVLEPDEPKRRAAQAAGELAKFSTPAGCAAFAVYGSGGSLGPPNIPDVPPQPYMTARAVSGCLALACVQGPPGTIPDIQRELVELGIAIAEGKITWPVVTASAAKPAGRGSPSGQRF